MTGGSRTVQPVSARQDGRPAAARTNPLPNLSAQQKLFVQTSTLARVHSGAGRFS